MANRKVLFRSAANINEVSPSADSILIASIDQQGNLFTLKASGTTLYSNSTGGLLTMNGDFSIVPATDDTGTIGVDPSEAGGDPLSVGSQKRFHLIRGRKIKAGATITLENSIDITNSADGVSAASTGRIKYESATQALRASENGGALDDVVLRTKVQTLTNKTFTAPVITDFTSSQHTHQNAAGGGQLDHGLALTGLSDDDHAQYAILAGRAGGQLLNGGTAASENLTLQSTANATRGAVIAADQLQTTSTAVIAAFRVGSVAGDPSTLANGDVWYNSTSGKFRGREAGTSKDLISAGSSGSLQGAYDNGVTITTTASGAILFTRGAAAVAADDLLKLVDANASTARTANVLFISDANTGTGVTQRITRTAGTDGVVLIEGNSTRTVAVRNQAGNADALIVDTVNGRLGLNRIAGVTTFVPAFDIHYQSQGANGSIVIDLYSDNGGENFEIIGRKSRGTVSAPTGLTDDDDMFEFGAYGHNGTTFSPQAAAILFEAAGTWSGTNNGTRQVYKTTLNGATVLREVMVLGDDACVVVSGGTNGLIGAVSGEFLRVVGNARVQGTVGAFTGTDVNPTAQLSGSSVLLGAGAASTPDIRWRRPAAGISVFDGNTANRTLIIDTANKRIGINNAVEDTFTPAFLFHTNTNDGSVPRYVSDVYDATAGNGGGFVSRRARGTFAIPTAVLSGDTLMSFGTRARGATVFATADRAAIRVAATENWTDTAQGTMKSAFVTANGGVVTAERFRIDQDGQLKTDVSFNIYTAYTDANPTARISGAALFGGAGGATALDARFARTAASTWTVDNNAGGGTLVLSAVTGALYYESSDGAAAAVSGAATGRIRYNNSVGAWQFSVQGGAYASFPTGSGTANTIPKWTAAGTLGNSVLVSDASDRTLTYTPAASVTGSPVILTVTGPAHTGLTAAEVTDLNFNLARSVQFTTGATVANQRAIRFQAPTYTATAATQTLTIASTLTISGAPVAGTNVSIGNAYALRVEGGESRFDGNVRIPAFKIYSEQYIMGSGPDLSLIPVVGGQSVMTTWWGLQLVGNKQSTVEYTPANIGGAADFSVAIPCQQAGAIGLLIRGQTSQTGNLLQFNNIGGTGLSCFDEVGRLGIGTVAPTSDVHIVQAISTSGTPTAILFTAAAHTTLTAAEAIDIDLNMARTVQFTSGATIASQRAMLFRAPTYSATAATQTITDAATLAVTGAPVQGTNVTLTRTWSAWFQGGSVRFDGDIIQVAGNNDFRAAVGDANPTQRQSGASILFGAGGASALDTRLARTSASAITIDNNAGGGTFVFSAVTGSLFYESSTGAAAAVSGAATGRLIYNNTAGFWQISTQAGAYQNVATVAVGGGTLAFVQNGNSFGGTATLGTNDANDLSFETGGVVRFTVLAASSTIQGNGGFTIFGGSGASETLTLNSTSNATKGKILFGASVLSGYVETTDSWGFGTVSPSVQWDFFQSAPSATLGRLRVRDSTSLLFEADLQNRKVNIYGASATAITDGILNVSSTTPLAILKGNAGGDYSATLRFAGEATDDWLGGYVQYDATGNELIIGVHNTTDKLVASDIESIRIVRASGDVTPGADAARNFGTSALRWTTVVANTHSVFGAVSDANPTVSITTQSIAMGAGGASALDVRMRRTAANTFTIDNNSTGGATIVPATTNTGVIGTDALKWNRIRATSVVTGDLEMKDEAKGVHYVLIEEVDGIYVKDMVKKKMFKIPMVEVPWRN